MPRYITTPQIIGANTNPTGVLAINDTTVHANANSKHTKQSHIITFAVVSINKTPFLITLKTSIKRMENIAKGKKKEEDPKIPRLEDPFLYPEN